MGRLLSHLILVILAGRIFNRSRKASWLLHLCALLLAALFLFPGGGYSSKKNDVKTANPNAITVPPVVADLYGNDSSDLRCDDRPVQYEDGIYDEVKSDYLNYEYGFKVKLPKDTVALTVSCPMPQHGFSMYLSKDHQSEIQVSANYDALFLGSLSQVYKKDMADLLDGDADCVVSGRRRVKLAGLLAIRYVTRWRDEDDRTPRIADTFIAMRGSQPKIIYSIYLSTSEARYLKDKKVLDQIVRHFRLTAIPS